jgi:hypothetical protein
LIVKIRDQFNEEAWCELVAAIDKGIIVWHYGREEYVPAENILADDTEGVEREP